MKKQIQNIGKLLNKIEQKNINGGSFGDLFIGSACYSQRRFCNSALASAISNGANPTTTRCESCFDPFSGTSGFQVRIYG